MKLLEGKVAIVTGAARGIGKAIAMRFAEEGASVVFTDLKVDENFQNTEKELQALGVKAKGYASNAADFEDTAGVVAQIVKDFGRIDVLVNNAGITRDGLMMRMSEQQWDMVINVNLKSAFNFIHAVTPVMMKQKSGSIINMASVASSVKGVPNRFAYTASKAAVIGLTKSVAADYVRQGIRCNAICPGTVDSPSLRQRIAEQALEQGRSEAEVYQAFVDRQPMGRIGSAEEIAQLALYLASDASSYTTGTVQVIDGGMSN